MPSNVWTGRNGPLQPGASSAFNTFTAATDLSVGDTYLFQSVEAQALRAGMQIHIEAWGVLSNTGTPNLTMGVYWGGAAGTALAVSTAKTTTTATVNWEWSLWYSGRVISSGPTGSIIGRGRWRLPTSLTAWTEFRLPETAPAAVTIDTTVDKNISIAPAWSASSASNTITCHQFSLRVEG